MGVDLAQPHAAPYTPSRTTGDTWTPRDTHNAEIESAGGADLQMARAVAHIKWQAARIAVLEEALRRAALHGIAESGPNWMWSSREALNLSTWVAGGMVGPLPEIKDPVVLDAIAERGGL